MEKQYPGYYRKEALPVLYIQFNPITSKGIFPKQNKSVKLLKLIHTLRHFKICNQKRKTSRQESLCTRGQKTRTGHPAKRSCPSSSFVVTHIRKISLEQKLTAGKSASVNVFKRVCEEWEVEPDHCQVKRCSVCKMNFRNQQHLRKRVGTSFR